MHGRPALIPVALLLALLAVAVPAAPAAALGAMGPGSAGADDVPARPTRLLPTRPLPSAPVPPPEPFVGPEGEPSRPGVPTVHTPEDPPTPNPYEGENTWLDASHGFLEAKLLAPVVRFDRFFSDETELDVERARSFLRWRNEVRYDPDGSPAYTTSVRANLRFPAFTRALRRLRLVLEGETRDAFDALFPGDPAAAVSDAPLGEADAELRLRLWDGLLAHADVGAGLLLELPPGAFGRLRLRWNIPLGRRFLTRLATVGSYRTDERFGVSTDLHLERPFGPNAVARFSSGVKLTQRSLGVEWRSELATFVALGDRSAAAVGVGVNGAARRSPELERFRVFTRLRRDFYRRWLFFELEPEYAWPYSPEEGRHVTWALTGRLEVQFQGREPEREPLEPEPPDPPPPQERARVLAPPSGPG